MRVERMRFFANLRYDDSDEAQNGSGIEFMRLGDREFALAGTLRNRSRRCTTAPRAPATCCGSTSGNG